MTTMVDDRLLEKLLPHAKWTVEKFHGDSTAPEDLYEVIEGEYNLLTFIGASVLWEALIGNGVATAGNALAFYSSSNAAIGVGDSTTAAATTQTVLQGTANVTDRFRKTATVTHTHGSTSTNASITFVSTFATTEANFAWQEWGIFNSATDAIGTMLNRKVESLGTKTSVATWQITITLTLG